MGFQIGNVVPTKLYKGSTEITALYDSQRNKLWPPPPPVVYAAASISGNVFRYDGTDTTVVVTGLGRPRNMAADATGAIYIPDTTNNQIVRWDGTSQTVLPITGLSSPQGVAVDSSGVYVADKGNNRIVKWDGNNQTVDLPGIVRIGDVALDSEGNRYFITSSPNTVVKWDGTDQTVLPITLSAAPTGVAIDNSNGDVYVSSYDAECVIRWDGENQTTLPLPSAKYFSVDARDGVCYACNFSGGVVAWNGTTVTELPISGLTLPGGVVAVSSQSPPEPVTLKVDHTKVLSDLTDFPVYVDMSTLPPAFWTAFPVGGAVRCFDSTGAELAHELVACDTATKTGALWVKTDLSSSSDTAITIHAIGGAEYAPDDPFGARAVWTNGYAGVWHGDINTDSVAGRELYSSTNYDSVIPGPTGSAFSVADGTSGQGVVTPDVDAVALLMWVRKTPPAGHSTYLIDARPAQSGGYIWTSSASIVDGRYGVTSAGSSWNNNAVYLNGDKLARANAIDFNAIVGSFGRIYLQVSSGTLGNVTFVTRYNLSIEGGGDVGEIHLLSIARTAEWIAAEYANQSDPSTFYTVT